MTQKAEIISAEKAFTLMQTQAHNHAFIDVRSESEYKKSNFPIGTNLPILDNEYRKLVGTAYKKYGKERAIFLGNQLTENNKLEIIKKWTNKIEHSQQKTGIIFCWRGGLRSKTACEWIHNNGFSAVQVKGGFKELRKVSRSQFETYPAFIVLTGLTGSKKTQLIRESKNSIDLEKIAQHKGSAFGSNQSKSQPNQVCFENHIALCIANKRQKFLVEDESRFIGRCQLPPGMYENMRNSPIIELKAKLEDRCESIYQEYIHEVLQYSNHNELYNSLQFNLHKIKSRLGGSLYNDIKNKIKNGFDKQNKSQKETHIAWIKKLLVNYYDKRYKYLLTQKNHHKIFSGNFKECAEFINYYDFSI